MPNLSVIIVSYNTVDLLRACLTSVFADMADEDFEVLVVDNASSDGSPEMVMNDFPEAILVRNKTNVGFAKANNQAIARSSGKYIMLLNADARLVPGCSARLVDRMRDNPALGICGPAILNEDGSRQPSWGRFPSLTIEFAFQAFLYKVLPVPYTLGRRVHPLLRTAYSHFRFVDWLTAAAMLIRRDVIERVGPLSDESFMYSEDVEFCFRARQAGFEIGYEPAGEVVHRIAGSRQNYEDWIANITEGAIKYFSTHHDPRTVARAATIMIVGNQLRYVIWQVLGVLRPSRRAESRSRCKGYRRAIAIVKKYT